MQARQRSLAGHVMQMLQICMHRYFITRSRCRTQANERSIGWQEWLRRRAAGRRQLAVCDVCSCVQGIQVHRPTLSEFTTRIYRRTRCRSDSEGKDFACFEQNAGHKHSAGADHSQAVARRKKFAPERSRSRWAYEGLMAIVCVGKGEGYG